MHSLWDLILRGEISSCDDIELERNLVVHIYSPFKLATLAALLLLTHGSPSKLESRSAD